MKPISINETKEVTLNCDTEAPKTIWVISPIDSITFAEIEDKVTTYEVVDGKELQTINFATQSVNIVRACLKEIKGKDWNTKEITDETIRLIEPKAIKELAKKIVNYSILDMDEQESLEP